MIYTFSRQDIINMDLFQVFQKASVDVEACNHCSGTEFEEEACIKCGTICPRIVYETQGSSSRSLPSPQVSHMANVIANYKTIPPAVVEQLLVMFSGLQYELRNNRPHHNSLFYTYVL